jgi:hypothetical protein
MTIRPGDAWGRSVDPPQGLVEIADDAELARRLADADDGGPPLLVTGGDLGRTVGAIAPRDRDGSRRVRNSVNELPIDLLEVRGDGGAVRPGCAHAVIRLPWWRGGWLRGPIVLVMNAEFIGRWDVAPRSHPNDGRADVIQADTSFGLRQRLAARRRLPSGSHVPHPALATRSVRSAEWTFARPMLVIVDGRPIGRFRTVGVTVVPDAAVVHA